MSFLTASAVEMRKPVPFGRVDRRTGRQSGQVEIPNLPSGRPKSGKILSFRGQNSYQNLLFMIKILSFSKMFIK